MFWLRYSWCIVWAIVTDESNTDHDKGTKNKGIDKASVNLLSFLFSFFFFFSFSKIIFVFFFAFLFLLTPMLVSILSIVVLFSTLMMSATTSSTTTFTTYVLFSICCCVERLQMCTSERTRERERKSIGKHTPVWLFFFPSYCCLYTYIYIVHLMQWLTEVTLVRLLWVQSDDLMRCISNTYTVNIGGLWMSMRMIEIRWVHRWIMIFEFGSMML